MEVSRHEVVRRHHEAVGIPDQQKSDWRDLGAAAVNLKSEEKTFGCNDRIKSIFLLYVLVWVNIIGIEIDILLME